MRLNPQGEVMKNLIRNIVLIAAASSALSAQAGTVDVGSGSMKANVQEEVSLILPLDKVYFGTLTKKTSRGEIDTDIPCTVFATVEGSDVTVQVVNMSLQTAGGTRSQINFSTKIDGSELSSQPAVSSGQLFRELSMQTVGKLTVVDLTIRAIEGGAIVSLSERFMGDFDIPDTKLACSIQ